MSLVSDALRRARQEAAERDGGADVPRFPAAIVHPARSSRLGFGMVLGATITLLAAAGGGAAAWWILGAHSRGQAMATTDPASSVQPAASHDGAASAIDQVAPPAPAAIAPVQSRDRDPAPALPAAESSAAGTAHPADPTGIPLEPPVARVPVEPEAPAGTAGGHQSQGHTAPTGPREFIAEATLGHVTLSLDYIAYRPSDPFVQINGVELHEGYHIEGFTVERIGPDEVELRDAHGPLILRVR